MDYNPDCPAWGNLTWPKVGEFDLANGVLTGDMGSDTLDGGRGDDTLIGSSGADTYLYSLGDGNDTVIDDSGIYDVLRFDGSVQADQIILSCNEEFAFLTMPDGSIIKLKNWLESTFQLERIEFADGTVWTNAEFMQRLMQSTPGPDMIIGSDAADALLGGAGNDTLSGRDGNDTLSGGRGDDVLTGGAGNDMYQFARGDGVDRITRQGWDWANSDVLRFDSSIDESDVVVKRNGADLALIISGSADQIVLVDWFGDGIGDPLSWDSVQRIEFTSGAVWTGTDLINKTLVGTIDNDNIVGTSMNDTVQGLAGDDILAGASGNDTLIGGAGNDLLDGGDGNDIYRFDLGDGNDTISGWSTGWGDADVVAFGEGIIANDVLLSGRGADLLISTANQTESILIQDFFAVDDSNEPVNGTLHFADGTTWNSAAARSRIPQAVASGGQDNVTLYSTQPFDGLGGDDIIVGQGSSIIRGGEGADSILLASGQGSVVHGDDGEDHISAAYSLAYALYGDAGNDNVTIERSQESYVSGGDGDDSVALGYSYRDTVEGDAGVDRIEINRADSDMVSGGNGSDFVHITNSYATVVYGGDGDDQISIDAGSVLSIGGSGKDRLSGGTEAQMLIGGADDDTIAIGSGAHVVAFNRGDGKDTLLSSGAAAGTLSLGGGLSAADLLFSRDGQNLMLTLGANDAISFEDWYSGAGGHHGVTTLQLILTGDAYTPGSSNEMINHRVQQFNFEALVDEFDAQQVIEPSAQSWGVSEALMRHHLASTDDFAAGGMLALEYGKNSNLSGLELGSIRDVMKDWRFGDLRQSTIGNGGGPL